MKTSTQQFGADPSDAGSTLVASTLIASTLDSSMLEKGAIGADMLVAVLSAGVAAVALWFAYNSMLALEVQPDTALSVGPEGVTNYRILQDDTCVGEFTVTARENELTEILMLGSIRVAGLRTAGLNRDDSPDASADESLIKVKISSFFNPLGQLFRAALSAESPGVAGSIVLADVQPIDVSVVVSSPEFNLQRKLKLPGPIEVERVQERSGAEGAQQTHYTVKYGAVSAGVPGVSGEILAQLNDRLQQRVRLRTDVATDPGPICGPFLPGALSLVEIRQTLAPLIALGASRNGPVGNASSTTQPSEQKP